MPDRLPPAVFESNMMKLIPSKYVAPSFLAHYLRSLVGRVRLTIRAKWAVNQASINQSDVCATPVPLPPLAEQHRIVDRGGASPIRHPAGRSHGGGQPEAGRAAAPEHPQAGLLRQAGPPGPQRRAGVGAAGAHPRGARIGPRGRRRQAQARPSPRQANPCGQPVHSAGAS